MKRSLIVFVLLWSFVGAHVAPVAAQTAERPAASRPTAAGVATATAPARPAPQAVAWVNRKLANGLEVVVLEDHSVPLVTVEMAVKNGSFTEPPELNGLSHLFEHMFFKSNRATANQEEYLQRIGQLGIAYNGSTREEIVNYYYTTTTPNYTVAMRLMRDSIR